MRCMMHHTKCSYAHTFLSSPLFVVSLYAKLKHILLSYTLSSRIAATYFPECCFFFCSTLIVKNIFFYAIEYCMNDTIIQLYQKLNVSGVGLEYFNIIFLCFFFSVHSFYFISFFFYLTFILCLFARLLLPPVRRRACGICRFVPYRSSFLPICSSVCVQCQPYEQSVKMVTIVVVTTIVIVVVVLI